VWLPVLLFLLLMTKKMMTMTCDDDRVADLLFFWMVAVGMIMAMMTFEKVFELC